MKMKYKFPQFRMMQLVSTHLWNTILLVACLLEDVRVAAFAVVAEVGAEEEASMFLAEGGGLVEKEMLLLALQNSKWTLPSHSIHKLSHSTKQNWAHRADSQEKHCS